MRYAMIADAVKNLTLLDVSVIVLFIAGLIKGVQELKKSIKEFFQNKAALCSRVQTKIGGRRWNQQ